MRKSLQITLAVLSLIPLVFAGLGLLNGAGYFLDPADVPPPLDNQLRYLSGVYILVTLLLWRYIPRIESAGPVLGLVCLALVTGGVGRLISYLTVGSGDAMQLAGMILELGSPVFYVWQQAVAKQHIFQGGYMRTIGPKCTLGEGPLWHPERDELFWFDIPAGKMFSCNAQGADLRETGFGEPASVAGWIDRDKLLVGTASGLQQFDIATGGVDDSSRC